MRLTFFSRLIPIKILLKSKNIKLYTKYTKQLKELRIGRSLVRLIIDYLIRQVGYVSLANRAAEGYIRYID